MRISKTILVSLAVAVLLIFAGQATALAGANLETWPIDPQAKGDRSNGSLTIYYEVLAPGCGDIPGDVSVKMYFFLRLYEKKTKTWHVITAVDEGPYCLLGGIDSGAQQTALVNFLEEKVLPKLCSSCGYTEIHLKDVEDDYENITVGPDPYCVSADIKIVAK